MVKKKEIEVFAIKKKSKNLQTFVIVNIHDATDKIPPSGLFCVGNLRATPPASSPKDSLSLTHQPGQTIHPTHAASYGDAKCAR